MKAAVVAEPAWERRTGLGAHSVRETAPSPPVVHRSAVPTHPDSGASTPNQRRPHPDRPLMIKLGWVGGGNAKFVF
jgi:hypothetical protein